SMRVIVEGDTADIRFQPWGAFLIMTCSAYYNNVALERSFMIGSKRSNDTSLVLLDHNFPFTITHTATLKGLIKVPKSGLKYGRIGRKYYLNQKVPEFNILESSSSFPSMKTFELQARKIPIEL